MPILDELFGTWIGILSLSTIGFIIGMGQYGHDRSGQDFAASIRGNCLLRGRLHPRYSLIRISFLPKGPFTELGSPGDSMGRHDGPSRWASRWAIGPSESGYQLGNPRVALQEVPHRVHPVIIFMDQSDVSVHA